MRIAVWHNLPSGGGNRALHDQVRGLVARGHHIEIWCPPTANRTFLPLGDIVREHVLPMTVDVAPKRVPFIRDSKVYGQVNSELGAMDRHCRLCADEINAGGFDVLLAHSSQVFHPTPIGRHVKVPGALYLQEVNRGYYEAMPKLLWVAPPPRNGRPAFGYWKEMARDLIRVQLHRIMIREELASATDFDLILCNSIFSRESILRAYNLESQVCYLGIDTELFRPTGSRKERFVVGLGSICDPKRPSLAVEALGTIEESVRPELVWIGNYADAACLQHVLDRARDLGVRFRPAINVPDTELVDTLGRASAMIYTSRLEPFGYAPLEANACGTAVVAIAEGGVKETVQDGLNGTLVADTDPPALGHAIRAYCADLDHALAAGQKARRIVEEKWNIGASMTRLERKLIELKARKNGAARPGSIEAMPYP